MNYPDDVTQASFDRYFDRILDWCPDCEQERCECEDYGARVDSEYFDYKERE